MSDDAKRLIFARRARFVAAALAGVAASACGDSGTGTPQPCLEPAVDASDTGPEACLSPPLQDASASDAADAGSDAGDAASDDASADAESD